MSSIVNAQVGKRVQHRGWFWYGTITEIPEGEIKYLSSLTVQRDGSQETEVAWIPSLILDTNEFVYDWSDQSEPVKRRTKSKGKKLKHKG